MISPKIIQNWVVTLFIMATIVVVTLTLIPLNGGGPKIPHLDKVIHFLMFGGWSFLFGWVLTMIVYRSGNKRKLLLNDRLESGYTLSLYVVVITGFIFGGIIEILQGVLPIGRTPDLMDTMANGLGAICAAASLKWISTKSFYRKSVEPEE